MEFREVIEKMRAGAEGFNPPASKADLKSLQDAVGELPDEILTLYRDHNGSDTLPEKDGNLFPVRLIPIHEIVEQYEEISGMLQAMPKAGTFVPLWTDENSSYCGMYTDGPLKGWLAVLSHDEPMLTPAFRSVASFVAAIGAEIEKGEDGEMANDLRGIARQLPETGSNDQTAEKDRKLAALFLKMHGEEKNEELAQLHAFCSIVLTPFEDTGEVLKFLAYDDMFIPEGAVKLLEVRAWPEGVTQLEKLANNGMPNGDSAAMRCLVRMKTSESKQAVERLKKSLKGEKAQDLKMWAGRKLLPARWE